ncbi:MAG: molybdopterin-dependent oxidoreductase [Alphaproteobacteria bacterium]|nr:molybdopterin-dependent oxidoreductase [Alphaproteobacteria bacterium]
MTTPLEPIRFTLDGEALAHAAGPDRSALDVLREDLGCAGLKPGCSPQGVCGSCTASVDGKPRLLCTLPFKRLEGKEVQTLDDMPEREAVAQGLAEAGAAQCGYCTPGIATQAALLLRRNPDPDAESVQRVLAMHSCRCTGWAPVIAGVLRAGALLRGEAVSPGPRVERNLGREMALGERPYVDDLSLPGMLHAAVVWAPSPRCRLESLDTEAALAAPGVRAVLSASDVPGERWIGLAPGERPLLLAPGEESAGVGDALAVVVAETREAARAARDAVTVHAETLAPRLRGGPVLAEARVRKGDVDVAFDDSSLVIAKGSFSCAALDPGHLEPSAAVATPLLGGGLHVWTNGEAPFEDRRQIAAALNLAPAQVGVEALVSGGAFGGKLEMGAQGLAALAAQLTGRPVKLSFDLDEGTRQHLRQAPIQVRAMLAARPDGSFVGLKLLVTADLGGRPSLPEAALRELAAHAGGPYNLPHVEVVAKGKGSDGPSAGPVAGAGLMALSFALEGCVDRLAEALGRDPVALREQNLLGAGDALGSGQRLERGGAQAALAALQPVIEAARAAGRPVGVACVARGLSALGGVEARAEIEVLGPQELLVRTGFVEQGQGHDTAAIALVAERCGLPASALRWSCDSGGDVDSGLSLGGRDLALGLPAVQAAAAGLAEAMQAAGGSLETLVGRRFEGRAEAPIPAVSASDAPTPLHSLGWAAHAAVLGEDGSLEALHVAQSGGPAFTPEDTRARLRGAAVMGIGAALSESADAEEGLPPARLRDLGLIKATTAPEVQLLLLEGPGALGPASGPPVEELAMIGAPAALAAAVRAHDGAWRSSLPMKDCPAAWSVGVRRPKAKKVRS